MANDESGDAQVPKLLRMYVPIMVVSLAMPALVGVVAALIISHSWAVAIPILLVVLSARHLFWLYGQSRKKLEDARNRPLLLAVDTRAFRDREILAHRQ